MSLEIYNQRHKIEDIDFNVRLVRNPSQDKEGKLREAGEFANKMSLVYYRRIVCPEDLFLEIEEKKSCLKDLEKCYIGMLFDTNKKFWDGIYWDHFGGGVMMSRLFIETRGKIIKGLAKELPKEISREIKDIYTLLPEEFDYRITISYAARRITKT